MSTQDSADLDAAEEKADSTAAVTSMLDREKLRQANLRAVPFNPLNLLKTG